MCRITSGSAIRGASLKGYHLPLPFSNPCRCVQLHTSPGYFFLSLSRIKIINLTRQRKASVNSLEPLEPANKTCHYSTRILRDLFKLLLCLWRPMRFVCLLHVIDRLFHFYWVFYGSFESRSSSCSASQCTSFLSV